MGLMVLFYLSIFFIYFVLLYSILYIARSLTSILFYFYFRFIILQGNSSCLLTPMRKMLGYIGDIYIGDISPMYHVLGGLDMIFQGEKSDERNFYKNGQKIADIMEKNNQKG